MGEYIPTVTQDYVMTWSHLLTEFTFQTSGIKKCMYVQSNPNPCRSKAQVPASTVSRYNVISLSSSMLLLTGVEILA